jgi:hypothetical protein
MRFVNVFMVFVAVVVVPLLPLHGATASGGPDFVEWALERGEDLDRNWGRITACRAPGAMTGSSTTGVGRSIRASMNRNGSKAAYRNRWTTANRRTGSGLSSERGPLNEGRNWIHSTAGFFHRGTPERFPLSTRNRAAPSRGTSKLRSPAEARLGISYDYRRIPNARVRKKHFFHSRPGRTRVSPRMGSRVSPFKKRCRVSARSSRRTARPR